MVLTISGIDIVWVAGLRKPMIPGMSHIEVAAALYEHAGDS